MADTPTPIVDMRFRIGGDFITIGKAEDGNWHIHIDLLPLVRWIDSHSIYHRLDDLVDVPADQYPALYEAAALYEHATGKESPRFVMTENPEFCSDRMGQSFRSRNLIVFSRPVLERLNSRLDLRQKVVTFNNKIATELQALDESERPSEPPPAQPSTDPYEGILEVLRDLHKGSSASEGEILAQAELFLQELYGSEKLQELQRQEQEVEARRQELHEQRKSLNEKQREILAESAKRAEKANEEIKAITGKGVEESVDFEYQVMAGLAAHELAHSLTENKGLETLALLGGGTLVADAVAGGSIFHPLTLIGLKGAEILLHRLNGALETLATHITHREDDPVELQLEKPVFMAATVALVALGIIHPIGIAGWGATRLGHNATLRDMEHRTNIAAMHFTGHPEWQLALEDYSIHSSGEKRIGPVARIKELIRSAPLPSCERVRLEREAAAMEAARG